MRAYIVRLDEEIFFYNMVNDFTVHTCVLFTPITHLLVIVSEPVVRVAIVLLLLFVLTLRLTFSFLSFTLCAVFRHFSI